MSHGKSIIPAERIEQSIFIFRGQKVLLDEDMAYLYGVTVGRLNEAVKRNIDRFPGDFMFQLTKEEFEKYKQFGQLNIESSAKTLVKRGGRRHHPFVFTEQGVAMLSSVLRSERAVKVNIEIMRAFVRLRHMLQTHEDLVHKLDALEKKYDSQFKIIFDAIRQLMAPPKPKKNQIGFHWEEASAPAKKPAPAKKQATRKIPAQKRTPAKEKMPEAR